MQGIIMSDAGRMRSGKRAMLTAATARDKYRISGQWHWVDEAEPGQAADEVAHFDRHLTRVGTVLEVEDDGGKKFGRIRIEGIALVVGASLTDQDMRQLGYESRAEFEAAHPDYGSRRAWFVRFEPVKRWWEVWR